MGSGSMPTFGYHAHGVCSCAFQFIPVGAHRRVRPVQCSLSRGFGADTSVRPYKEEGFRPWFPRIYKTEAKASLQTAPNSPRFSTTVIPACFMA